MHPALKILSTSFGAMSSKVGKTNLARLTVLFNFLRSTQIVSFPLLFCTGTMGAHHSVGPVTLSMISASFIRFSSSTFGIKGKAILLAVSIIRFNILIQLDAYWL